MNLNLAILGTDTGVGKTRVATMLVCGLRSLGRRVWVHKPVACGGWGDGQADDGRALAALCGDGQPGGTICPFQFKAPASPHLAARAEGVALDFERLRQGLAALRGDHDLVVEGVGGALVPISDDYRTIADLVATAGLPALIVASPRLGTLNHSALTVEALRARGVPVVGVVVNWATDHADRDVATATAAREITALTRVPVLAEVPHTPLVEGELGRRLAQRLLEEPHHA